MPDFISTGGNNKALEMLINCVKDFNYWVKEKSGQMVAETLCSKEKAWAFSYCVDVAGSGSTCVDGACVASTLPAGNTSAGGNSSGGNAST